MLRLNGEPGLAGGEDCLDLGGDCNEGNPGGGDLEEPELCDLEGEKV